LSSTVFPRRRGHCRQRAIAAAPSRPSMIFLLRGLGAPGRGVAVTPRCLLARVDFRSSRSEVRRRAGGCYIDVTPPPGQVGFAPWPGREGRSRGGGSSSGIGGRSRCGMYTMCTCTRPRGGPFWGLAAEEEVLSRWRSALPGGLGATGERRGSSGGKRSAGKFQAGKEEGVSGRPAFPGAGRGSFQPGERYQRLLGVRGVSAWAPTLP